MDENNTLQEILKDNIYKDLNKQYIQGIITGWRLCAQVLYKKALKFSSAKAIKNMIKIETQKKYQENSD